MKPKNKIPNKAGRIVHYCRICDSYLEQSEFVDHARNHGVI